MDINIKRQYIQALMKVNVLSPNRKTAKAILGLLIYYSSGSFSYDKINVDALEGNAKADALFGILNQFTDYDKCHNSFNDEDYYGFTRFDIPKEIRETIIRKYEEQLKASNWNKREAKRQAELDEQKRIQEINDNLNNTL